MSSRRRVEMVSVPPSWHRIARIDRKVEDGELELVGIGRAMPASGSRTVTHLRSMAPIACVSMSLMPMISALTSTGRAASFCVREKASSCAVSFEPRSAALKALPASRKLRGRSSRATDQVEIADDRGQQIVEIMRDAAGQLADRLHLLRLDQRRLRLSRCAISFLQLRIGVVEIGRPLLDALLPASR